MTYLDDEIEGRLDYTRGPERVFAGVIAQGAVDYADRVAVVIPGTDGGHLRWEDVRWMPRHGNELPTRGNECLVVMDNNTELWVVAWWSGNPNLVEAKRFVGTAGNPSFTNGWDNFGLGYEGANFYKDPFGIVHLGGTVKDGTLAASAFPLPVGYRPAQALIFHSSATSNATRVDVYSDGTIFLFGSDNDYFGLNGITFLAEQ